jgi:preprotein translocase subunit SecF
MYSSLFIASPILIVWENKEWRNWFRRSNNKKEAVA